MQAKYQREAGCGGTAFESHGEYHLPDYAGDLKKILSTSARVVPAGRFFGEDEVQFGGAVQYDFWYLDAENRLTHEGFTTDYEFSCPHAEQTDGTASVSIAHFSLRPSGPRRISAKATLQARVQMREEAEYALECEMDPALLQTAQRSIPVGRMFFSKPEEREYAEALPLPAPYAAGAEVAFCEGFVQIERAEADEGGVVLHGTYAVSAVLMADGAAPLRVAEEYALEERLPLEGTREGMDVMASGFFSSLTTNLSREEDGARLTFHGICELSAAAAGNEQITVVEDAFAVGGRGEAEFEVLSHDCFGPSQTALRTVELRLSIGDAASEIPDGIFHTTVMLKNEAHEMKERELFYTAEAEICALGFFADEAGKMHYTAHKSSAPFSVQIPLVSAPLPDGKVSVEASVGLCEGRMDEGAIETRFCLMLSVCNQAQRQCSCVSRIRALEGTRSGRPPSYEVYYPSEGESLWSIAKRYGVSPASLAAANHIAVSSAGAAQNLPSLLLIDCRK